MATQIRLALLLIILLITIYLNSDRSRRLDSSTNNDTSPSSPNFSKDAVLSFPGDSADSLLTLIEVSDSKISQLNSEHTSTSMIPETRSASSVSKSKVNETHRYYRPFPLTIAPKDPCPKDVTTLFIVHSANKNRIRRNAARSTYAEKYWQEKYDFRTLFIVGKSVEGKDNWLSQIEADEFNDIVQGDFIDAYRNLTIKALLWERFVRDYCPNVTLIIKIDDDILPNIFWLFDDIQQGKLNQSRTFTGMCYSGPIDRRPDSPYYVSKDAHSADFWESFTDGPAYIQTADLCDELVAQAETHYHYVSADDAFITGQLASEIGAEHNFEIYKSNYQIHISDETEQKMVAQNVIFGQYKSVASAKRIFKELQILRGIVTDPPESLPQSNKMGPKKDE